MTYVVVDLDNTLCDVAHRIEFAKRKEWEEFHARCYMDHAHADVMEALKLLPAEVEIIALTGRSESYRKQTWLWFAEHAIRIDYLLMRPIDNREADHILKPQTLIQFFAEFIAGDGTRAWDAEEGKCRMLCEVLCVLEDRNSVIKAFRDLGVACWQVREEL